MTNDPGQFITLEHLPLYAAQCLRQCAAWGVYKFSVTNFQEISRIRFKKIPEDFLREKSYNTGDPVYLRTSYF